MVTGRSDGSSNRRRAFLGVLTASLGVLLVGCQSVQGLIFPSTATSTFTPTQTSTPPPPLPPTATDTPTITATPTITDTPTITPTPTFDFPDVSVREQAHCRYGANRNYLHAGDLYAGDHGLLWNRNSNGTWLWVRFDKLWYACWVAASVVEVEGDIFSVVRITTKLPQSSLYEPPDEVWAERQGDE